MVLETLDNSFMSFTEKGKISNNDLSELLNEHSVNNFLNKHKFSDNDLKLLSEYCVNNNFSDEKAYKVLSICFMDRMMWTRARSCLYTRLYLLDNCSEEYSDTLKLLNTVDDRIIAEILPLPRSFLEKLFFRDSNYNFSKWKSKMHYTDQLTPYAYGFFKDKNSLTSISTISLKPGELILKTTPLVVAPWSFNHNLKTDKSLSTRNTYSCFHCLSVINKSFESLHDDKRLIACSKHPCECNYYFCSKDCLLNNGVVHSLECDHLVKLRKFSEYYLNPSLVLLVCRTLIKCSLNMDNTSRVCDLGCEPNFNNEILDTLLNFNLDYSSLQLYHHNVIEEAQKFASFLLENLGFDFCLHLTSRELVHLTLVLWVNCVPFTSYLNHSFDSVDNSMGGTIFSFKALEFKQSHTPNCVLHFDDNGKLTVRSIYEISPGTELTTNTFLDKYLPPFIQVTKFWSVSSLFSYNPNDSTTNTYFKDIFSIRCSNCLNSFCYSTNFLLSSETSDSTDTSNSSDSNNVYTQKSFIYYHWKCDTCNSPNTENLDLLQNKAENTFLKAQKLYFDGDFVPAKNLLVYFVNKWSSVLHPSHYLMYNSYLLLSGILMNKPGGNIFESLVYFRKALIALDSVLPVVCHERAYLYDRFADYLLQVKNYLRLKNNEYKNLKNLVMDSLYNSLWNWTIISGTGSYQSVHAIQKCRSVSFSLNIHSFPLSNEFVVNVPNKYSHVFKAATGEKVVPDSFSNKMANKLSPTGSEELNDNVLQNVSDFYSVYDVASMAFLAAQSGEYTDEVLDVLTTVQSYGILHLGTGLSVLGIVASNLNLDFFTTLLNSVYDRVVEYLEQLSKTTESNLEVSRTELYVMNLLYSLFGGNEMGVDLLVSIVTAPYSLNQSTYGNTTGNSSLNTTMSSYGNNSVCTSTNSSKSSLENSSKSSETNEELTLFTNKEKNMVNNLFGYASKFRSLLKQYSTKLNPKVISPNFYKFINSDYDFAYVLLNRTTHSILSCQTPLHYASAKGKNELVKYFLKLGSSVDTLNFDGATPLHLASFNGHYEVVKTLVEFKSNIYLSLKTGETPLHLAVYCLQIKTVKFLLGLYKDYSLNEFEGPSVWHALVSGVFRSNDNECLESESNSNVKNIDRIIDNLSKAIEISRVLVNEMETQKYLSVYIWANYLPSQLLVDLWNQSLEGDSLFSFPKRPPTVYVVSNLSGIMEKPLKSFSAPGINGHSGLYGSLKQSTYSVNNYVDLNSKNDLIFTATRTFQFLVEILKDLEEQLVKVSTH